MAVELKKLVTMPLGHQRSKAMTLIEILIVIALIGTVMTVVVTTLINQDESAKEKLAEIGIENMRQSIRLYKLDNQRYPTTAQGGLRALVENPGNAKKWKGPYVDDENKLNDPWGNEYEYESADGRKFVIKSSGQDQEFDTADDIVYPKVDNN